MAKSAIRRIGFLSGLLLLAAVISCTQKAPAQLNSPKKEPTFGDAEFAEVVALADGSAYAKSEDSRIWYMRGGKAVLVTVSNTKSSQSPEFDEIYPVLGGGAYATSILDGGLWYLREDRAEKVSDVSSLTELGALSPVPADEYFTLYAAERTKRRIAEQEAETAKEPPDDYPDEPADAY
jgi:hypothetical protein